MLAPMQMATGKTGQALNYLDVQIRMGHLGQASPSEAGRHEHGASSFRSRHVRDPTWAGRNLRVSHD